jgi:hypothetical protein
VSEEGDYILEEVRLNAPGLTPGSTVRFAHLSDLHVRAGDERTRRVAQDLATRELDFVVITGDLVGKGDGAWDAMLEALSDLEARQGVFACRGNWELVRTLPRLVHQRRTLAEAGVTLLVNESQVLDLDAGRLRVAGLDDMLWGNPSIEEALDPALQADYTLLMAHQPLAMDMIGGPWQADLVLSGHTHGGQVRLPVLWRAMLPHGSGRYTDGLYEQDGRHLYVSRGFGAVGPFKVRYRCPAEVALFELFGV